MKVAIPWSLSHYIPLNGFHPLYRALFDHAPAGVELNAWDNVKLHHHFRSNGTDLQTALRLTDAEKHRKNELGNSSLAKAHSDFNYAPDRVLADALIGDVEFHHTAPFPSLKRPFVLHCESFAPVFLPFAQQGSGGFENHDALRTHYGALLAHPLCLGIHSHIPETLESLGLFFSDERISNKLFGSRIGLSSKSIDLQPSQAGDLQRARFLFVNSANQNPANFFHRGGHVVLRFWREFCSAGRQGQLILRCKRPDDELLSKHGVDTSFVRAQSGRSIIWAEDFLANHEINALMASAHFFLLPSASLHSVSILSAMTLGTIPVVTDTIGTSTYVTDREDSVVLTGVRDELWVRDPNTGILVDRYRRIPALDRSLVSQLTQRIFELMDSPETYWRMGRQASETARTRFSGEAFSIDFWHSVAGAYERIAAERGPAEPSDLSVALRGCTLASADWPRVFESVTQPVRRLDTGQSSVWELGGTVVHAFGNPPIELQRWSVLAKYVDPDAPDLTFATDLVGLEGKFLTTGSVQQTAPPGRLRGRISALLMPYPGLHSLAARTYKVARKARHLLGRWRQSIKAEHGRPDSRHDIELVAEGIAGYNVIRYFHKYYGILQDEGEFSIDGVRRGEYSSVLAGYSLDSVLRKINRRGARQRRKLSGGGLAVNSKSTRLPQDTSHS